MKTTSTMLAGAFSAVYAMAPLPSQASGLYVSQTRYMGNLVESCFWTGKGCDKIIIKEIDFITVKKEGFAAICITVGSKYSNHRIWKARQCEYSEDPYNTALYPNFIDRFKRQEPQARFKSQDFEKVESMALSSAMFSGLK